MKIVKGFLLASLIVFLTLGQIRVFDEIGYKWNGFAAHVNTRNTADSHFKDVNVRVFLPEMGILVNSNPFDLSPKGDNGQFVSWQGEQIAPGDYMIVVYASNDQKRERRARFYHHVS